MQEFRQHGEFSNRSKLNLERNYRAIRGSRVTNLNKESLSDSHRRDLASAMNQSVSTATDRYLL